MNKTFFNTLYVHIWKTRYRLFEGEWFKYKNFRYDFSSGKMNQSQARAYCHEQQAELTSVNSFQEHNFLETKLRELG